MIDIKRKRLTKIVIGIVVILLVALGIFLKLLLSNSSYNISQVKVSAQLVDKIQESRKNGTTLKVNNDELNEIISMYFKDEKTVKGVLIKGIHGEVLDKSMKLYVPSSYKGISFLLTSEGTLNYNDNKIIYKPSYFKVGKITLPENMVMNKLSTYMKKTISVKDGNIIVDSSALPIKIKSLDIKNSEIYIGTEKSITDLESKLKSIENNINSSGLKEELKNKAAQNGASGSNTDSKGSSTDSKASGSVKNTPEMSAALDRISSSLSNAESSAGTASQKSVISGMISAVNDMKSNPNADPSSYSGSVRAQYNNLSSQDKAQLKAAVLSNINGSDINIVNSILGK